mmetsp:Transcript_121678/g.351262  ORF Transcript_121678/g.351262 Transcript_121678/m.351262 type:complete len:238 (-) Transcript_121678:3441-4154(-)
MPPGGRKGESPTSPSSARNSLKAFSKASAASLVKLNNSIGLANLTASKGHQRPKAVNAMCSQAAASASAAKGASTTPASRMETSNSTARPNCLTKESTAFTISSPPQSHKETSTGASFCARLSAPTKPRKTPRRGDGAAGLAPKELPTGNDPLDDAAPVDGGLRGGSEPEPNAGACAANGGSAPQGPSSSLTGDPWSSPANTSRHCWHKSRHAANKRSCISHKSCTANSSCSPLPRG